MPSRSSRRGTKRKPTRFDEPAASRPPPAESAAAVALAHADLLKLADSLPRERLTSLVASLVDAGGVSALALLRSALGKDMASRKLFVYGLGPDATSDALRATFAPFGELEEVTTMTGSEGRCAGFGFVTFRHADSAFLALKEPSKLVGNNVAAAKRVNGTTDAAASNTAAAAQQGSNSSNSASAAAATNVDDIDNRRVYIGHVPADMNVASLRAHFATYGEIVSGPFGFDKKTGKFSGYALFIYQYAEGARAALAEPNKVLDGHRLHCKLAHPMRKPQPDNHNSTVPTPNLNPIPPIAMQNKSTAVGSIPAPAPSPTILQNEYLAPNSALFTDRTNREGPSSMLPYSMQPCLAAEENSGLTVGHTLNGSLSRDLDPAMGLLTGNMSGSQLMASKRVSSLIGGGVGAGGGGVSETYGDMLDGAYGLSSHVGALGSSGHSSLGLGGGLGSSLYGSAQSLGRTPKSMFHEASEYLLSGGAPADAAPLGYQSKYLQEVRRSSPEPRIAHGVGLYPTLPPSML